MLHSLERWDGNGEAYGLAAEDIALPARFAALATQAVILDRLGGPEMALEMVRRRAGGWFDPAVTTTFERVGPDLLRRLAETDVWAKVPAAEPQPARQIAAAQLDDMARAFADMVDLLTPFTLGHSAGVAELAEAAGQRLRLPSRRLRRPATRRGAAAGRPAPDPGPKHLAGGPFRAGGRGAAADDVWTVEPPDRRDAGRFIPTAEHHVQHIDTEIGASTRAAAAMFAMEHGPLR